MITSPWKKENPKTSSSEVSHLGINNPYILIILIGTMLVTSIYFGFAIYHLVNRSHPAAEPLVSSDELVQSEKFTNEIEENLEKQAFSAAFGTSDIDETSDSIGTLSASAEPIIESSAQLSIPIIGQNPELYNGCEVTSLAMLLQYYGFEEDISKLDLAEQVRKDDTTIKIDAEGNIQFWGDPNVGFVGDITGKHKGLGVYHAPLFQLLQQYIPDAIDLSGMDFRYLEAQVSQQIPVVVWTTVNFVAPTGWITWDSPTGEVKTTFKEHAVLLVGYDEENVYVNDPLGVTQSLKLDRQRFMDSWEGMGRQAISYKG